jgi:hypothetical protein
VKYRDEISRAGVSPQTTTMHSSHAVAMVTFSRRALWNFFTQQTPPSLGFVRTKSIKGMLEMPNEQAVLLMILLEWALFLHHHDSDKISESSSRHALRNTHRTMKLATKTPVIRFAFVWAILH